MSATINKIENENIAVATYEKPFNPLDDLTYVQTELERILGEIDGPLHVVVDLRLIDLTFSELVQSLGTTVQTDSSASSKSGRVAMTFVGSGEMIKMASEAYAQEQYGGLKVNIFGSLDEALAHVRN